MTVPSATALASSPDRDLVQRVLTASSARDSSIDSTAPSRRTTRATGSDPTGSSQCRSNRQASAWLQVTEQSAAIPMSPASHRFRTTGVLGVLADPPSLSHDGDSAPSRLTSRHTGSPLLSTGGSEGLLAGALQSARSGL